MTLLSSKIQDLIDLFVSFKPENDVITDEMEENTAESTLNSDTCSKSEKKWYESDDDSSDDSDDSLIYK